MVEYAGYDAVVVGNHDIETGHPVYDRLVKTMNVPFLAAILYPTVLALSNT
jgi:2',3'-cyclic-nucleotide 2'-phosphodiesterase/3'-nucleotidase